MPRIPPEGTYHTLHNYSESWIKQPPDKAAACPYADIRPEPGIGKDY